MRGVVAKPFNVAGSWYCLRWAIGAKRVNLNVRILSKSTSQATCDQSAVAVAIPKVCATLRAATYGYPRLPKVT